jgi:hypothetical protein
LAAIEDTVDTLVLEFEGATFVALASDVTVCELGQSELHVAARDLDALLGVTALADKPCTSSTYVHIATTRGPVTFTSSARPRFITSSSAMFFRLPRVIVRHTADWVRGVHMNAEHLCVWIDLPRLAASALGNAA